LPSYFGCWYSKPLAYPPALKWQCCTNFREKYPWKWNTLESDAESDEISQSTFDRSTEFYIFGEFFSILRARNAGVKMFKMWAKVDHRDVHVHVFVERETRCLLILNPPRTTFCTLVRLHWIMSIPLKLFLKRERERERKKELNREMYEIIHIFYAQLLIARAMCIAGS